MEDTMLEKDDQPKAPQHRYQKPIVGRAHLVLPDLAVVFGPQILYRHVILPSEPG